MLTICITGAAGQIAYSFIPLLLGGQVFGESKIALKLLDIPAMEKVLKGVEMEILDCAYELLESIEIGSDPKILFKDTDVIVFLGGYPRKPGMERKDLLQINAQIFKTQGQALNEVGKADVKCLVVANPANTNCMILSKQANKINPKNFTCLTRLDQNRAYSLIAQMKQCSIKDIKNIIIWGNHSTTQYPSLSNATIKEEPIKIEDDDENLEYITRIQKRGAEVLAARGNSSVFSAANGVKDHLKDWMFGRENSCVSMGVISSGEYGIPEGLCFSYPIRCLGNFKWEIQQNWQIDEFSRDRIDLSARELCEERNESSN